MNLREKLKNLIPLIDRLNYECIEVKRATKSSIHSIIHLLYLNKSMKMYSEDGDRVKEMLKVIGDLYDKESGIRVLEFLKFSIKYLENCEVSQSIQFFKIV